MSEKLGTKLNQDYKQSTKTEKLGGTTDAQEPKDKPE